MMTEITTEKMMLFPEIIPNHVAGIINSSDTFEKYNPATGELLCRVVRSQQSDVNAAVTVAEQAQPAWAAQSSVARGKCLLRIAQALEAGCDKMAHVIALETGKSLKEALGETAAAVQLAEFFSGEGMRLYGKTLQSGNPNKHTMTVREPLGVAGLIVAANTPIANVAWKVFPALICGNAVVLKAAEDTPATAWLFAEIARESGLPAGLLNVIQGFGKECGEALVQHSGVKVISFTGSTAVGRRIGAIAAERLARCSLELGGKNPLVVCDDADVANALKWTLLSSFSNAGQRCVASSRLIVMDAVYEKFRDGLVNLTKSLRLGNSDNDDLGPVINERQLNRMLKAIAEAKERGAHVLVGGERLPQKGYYMAPTVIDAVGLDDPLSHTELFGPITVLYRARDFSEAIKMANHSDYGLGSAVHTKNIDRAFQFTRQVRTGVVNVNAGTHGSEPHYPFGGFGLSGNGTREPGEEALNVYSELKAISFITEETLP